MKRKVIYCIVTLLVAFAAFLILPKSSKNDLVSKDNTTSVVQRKIVEEASTIENNSRNGLASTPVTETPEVIDLSDKVKVKKGRPPRWKIYVDEEMADKIGLDRHERAEVERIIDYYKNEMDQINLNNAKVSTLSDNTFFIQISKAEEQGREVGNLLLEEISTAIGEEKFKKFLRHDNKMLADYFNGFGQSARSLEIEVKTDTFYNKSGEVIFSWEIAEIKDTFEDFGFSSGSRLPIGRLGNYAAIGTLID